MLDSRAFIAGAGALAVAAPARAQRRVPRIAYLSVNPPNDFRSQGFRDGMREFRYTEGTDFIVEDFFAVKIADMPQAAAAAVASLGRPGGNVTGPSNLTPDLAAKRLQLLTQIAPGIERVGILFHPDSSIAQLSMDELTVASQKLHVRISPVEVRTPEQIDEKIAGATANGIGALYFITEPLFTGNMQQVAKAALAQRLPAIYDFAEFPRAGGLISYGPNVSAIFRRAAYYVDSILKGAKPADLPVEQPLRFDFVINKKTADALGLEIPLGLLVGATEVIE